MKIRIITIGQKMPTWIETGYQEYAKRLGPMMTIQRLELPMARRSKTDSEADIGKLIQHEGHSILNALQPREQLIALEVGGRALSTEQLAQTLKQWRNDGQDIALCIGGPDGLSEAVRTQAAWHWSLSPLTLPHPMVRLIVIEQLYRAMTLLKGHPYHRA